MTNDTNDPGTDGTPTRRDLLRSGSAWALLGLLGCRGSSAVETSARPFTPTRAARSRVVLIRHKGVVGADGTPDAGLLRSMLNEAVTALTEAPDAASAGKRLVKPGDVVGVKTNVWRMLATPPGLEEAIRGELVAAGVKADNKKYLAPPSNK